MTTVSTQQNTDQSGKSEMQELLDQYVDIALPQPGDEVEGVVISASKNTVIVDLNGLATGVVRGPELVDESGIYSNLKTGDTVNVTVMDIENELGQIELSFREAGHKKAWDELERMSRESEVLQATIVDANKGGLLARIGYVVGFLPVSQLTVEHYPRVEGANKQKILERLKTYIGKTFSVSIIDVDESEEKLIVSEKAANQEEQTALLSEYSVGDIVEGVVTGVVGFGAFVEFGEGLEGLVHISELAWQRIDDPKDVISVGEKVKAQIISVENGKISLSVRRLQDDPWKGVAKKYNVGDIVEGTVLKINPFGAFVELDNDIHGLAHISELSWKKIATPEEVLSVGKQFKFKIVSIEPEKHRLGLSVKQLAPRPVKADPKPGAKNDSSAPSSTTKDEKKISETSETTKDTAAPVQEPLESTTEKVEGVKEAEEGERAVEKEKTPVDNKAETEHEEKKEDPAVVSETVKE